MKVIKIITICILGSILFVGCGGSGDSSDTSDTDTTSETIDTVIPEEDTNDVIIPEEENNSFIYENIKNKTVYLTQTGCAIYGISYQFNDTSVTTELGLIELPSAREYEYEVTDKGYLHIYDSEMDYNLYIKNINIYEKYSDICVKNTLLEIENCSTPNNHFYFEYQDSLVFQESQQSDIGIEWVFTKDEFVDLPNGGVSPEAITLFDNSIQLYSTQGQNIQAYRAVDGLTFSIIGDSFNFATDSSILKLDDNSYRMYYIDHENEKTIATATSTDTLNWTKESLTNFIKPLDALGWGVPDAVQTPDGKVRLFWVDTPVDNICGGQEVIVSAISDDGINFTLEDGYRMTDGFVDPYILSIDDDGVWLALFAAKELGVNKKQNLYIGKSFDGLSWNIDKTSVVSYEDTNIIDPTAVKLTDSKYRIYYSTIEDTPGAQFIYKSGVLDFTNNVINVDDDIEEDINTNVSNLPIFTQGNTIDIDGGTFGIPVYDGENLVVSGESSTQITITKYNTATLNKIGLTTTVIQANELEEDQIADHKHIFQGEYHYIVFSAHSSDGFSEDESLYIVKLDKNLNRVDYKRVVNNNGVTHDMWFTGDGTDVFIGIFRDKDVYKCNSELECGDPYRTLLDIGTHANGAAALYQDDKFYLVAPNTLAPGENDIYSRFVFDNNWDILGNQSTILTDTGNLSIVSALSYDTNSNTFIIHYGRGSSDTGGDIYRAVYDTQWNLLDNSPAISDGTNWTRPHSVVIGNKIFMAYDSAPTIKLTEFTME